MKMNTNNKNVNFLLFATLLVFFMVIYISCEKPTEDYRNKWVGTYECEKIRHEKQIVIIDITASGDSILNITERNLGKYEHGVACDVKVNNNGNFEKIYNEIGIERPRINGNFCDDSLFIYYLNFSPNITIHISYKGKKNNQQ